ncbi:unnamed protein product, partial [Porites lobata]
SPFHNYIVAHIVGFTIYFPYLLFRCTHLGASDNQKRWLVVGIALNKILVPQIRPFVEQEIDKEYNNLKTSHNIHTQSTSGRLQRWPARKFLKYENINGNSLHPKLPGGKYNISLFDCRVLSHIDFAKLYVENFMAKFNAFDDHCDASAVLTLLGGVPVFSAAVEAAAGDVRSSVRNDWAHCVFSKWDPVKFQQSFVEMEHLVRVLALPAADEAKLLAELKDWETKGTLLCMNSPVDPALLQLVQQEVKFLQDSVNNLSVEFDQEKVRVQQELQNAAIILEEMKQMVERLKTFQGNQDAAQRFGNLESRTGQVEDQVQSLEGSFKVSIKSFPVSFTKRSQQIRVIPEKLVELIRRDYKGAVLCPFPWCEDELQLKLSNIFTRLKIVSRTKERSQLTDNTVNMTDVFKPHRECHSPRVVLIEGNPGMGKTTYCQKLAYDWSVGEIPPDASFPEGKILLLLKCRDMHMKTANIEEAIDDQLLPQDAGKKEKEDFFHFIRSNQSRILLVLDGLDELREDLLQGFQPLIQGKLFPNVYVVLTARHEAGMRVRRNCDTLLEIVGYTNDDVDSYIRKYFSNHEDEGLAEKMIQKLKVKTELRDLTVNPLNTALLCLLWEERKGIFPSNRRQMYDELVSCALRRYFAKNGVSLGNYDNPLDRCSDQLNHLGEMAFEALLKNQLYFSQDDQTSTSTDFLQLPFLSREPSVSKIRPRPCYAFTHKTFQEYFSALYLAQQTITGNKGKAQSLLAQLSPVDNWQVWEFLIPMVSSKSSEMAVFVVSRLCAFFYQERLRNTIEPSIDSSVSWDVMVCKRKIEDWTLDIHSLSGDEQVLEEVVTKTLAVIANCEEGENKLDDNQRKMVHVLARCFPVRKLIFVVSRRNFKVYSEYLKANCTLTDLLLKSNEADELFFLGASWLANGLKQNCTLQYLDLSDNVDSDPVAVELASALESSSSLTHLDLSHTYLSFNEIREVGAASLGEALQTNCSLSHLYLSGNAIGDSGTASLGEGLKSNCTLTRLYLTENEIGDPGAEALGEAMQSNRNLTHLNLYTNAIGDIGAAALASALKSSGIQLTHLDLAVNEISCVGAEALAKALESNSSLKGLDLEDNAIGSSGASSFGKALRSNRTLTHLIVTSNDITESGAAELVDALLINNSLIYLNAEHNAISSLEAENLKRDIQSHCVIFM